MTPAVSVEAPEVPQGRTRTDTDVHGRSVIVPEAVAPRGVRVGETPPLVPTVPASPVTNHASAADPWDRRHPAGSSLVTGRQDAGAPRGADGAILSPIEAGGQAASAAAREGAPEEIMREMAIEPSTPITTRRRAAAAIPVVAPRIQDVGAGLAPAREGVNPSPASLLENVSKSGEVGKATTPQEPVQSAAIIPERTVVTEQSLLVTPTRVVPSGSEPAGTPQTASRQETLSRTEGPRVHIGVVEVVVAAPAPVEKRATASAPAPSSNLASRRYLRSL